MLLIQLYSDSFQGEIFTVDAYESVVLEMSTGDVAMHRAELVICPVEDVEWENVYQFDAKNCQLIAPLMPQGCEIWNPSQAVS